MDEANKLEIILIDDDVKIREILAETLGDNYNVKQYSEFYCAIQRIKHKIVKPDIIVMDVLNSGYHGDEFLDDLLEEGIQIPTIAMSGDYYNDRVIKAICNAQRMYTPKQQKALGITLDEPDSVTKKIEACFDENSHLIKEGLDPYFVFKPIDIRTLKGYLQKISATIRT